MFPFEEYRAPRISYWLSHAPIWVKRLRVGDTVCNCSYRHLKIVGIRDEIYAWKPDLVLKIVYNDLAPMWIEDAWEWFCEKLGLHALADRWLLLENGRGCNARACCHPHDHESFDEWICGDNTNDAKEK